MSNNDKQSFLGRYHHAAYSKGRRMKWEEWTPNSVTRAGKAQLMLLAGDASAVPFTFIGVGTSNAAVADTQTALQAEIVDSGLVRAAGTVSRVTTVFSNDTLQIVASFTVSAPKSVEEMGAFNASSAGTMLSRILTGTKSLTTSDVYVVIYQLQAL